MHMHMREHGHGEPGPKPVTTMLFEVSHEASLRERRILVVSEIVKYFFKCLQDWGL